MRVLLTGATGQIGRAIAHYLGSHDYTVTGLSRNVCNVPGLSEHIQVDLGTEAAVDRIRSVVPPCEAIVHAAASMSHDRHDPLISLTNCLGTQQILGLADIWKSRHLVYLSSVPVIGHPQQIPITEDHPVQPLSAYHASKLYGEHLVRLAQGNECHAVCLRLTSPSGAGTPENRILATFVRKAAAQQPLVLLGRGTRRQNYVDVRDIAEAVGLALHRLASGVYNIAATESTSNYDLAQTCIQELSSNSTVEFVEKPDPEEGIRWEVSIAKAQQDLGYFPRFTIRDSIRAIAHEHPGP